MILNNYSTDYTLVSNTFLEEYMPEAEPLFCVIYLYILKLSYENNQIGTEEIADKFQVLESDVIKALKYWDKKGIIKYIKKDDEEIIDFSTIDIKPNKKQIKSQLQPKYTEGEISDLYDNKTDIKEIFEFCEKILGKPLNSPERNLFISLYEWYGLNKDLIRLLVEYCVSIGKTNMRYIETVAINWCEKGIDTVEKAEENLILFKKDYRKIMSSCGQGSRQPLDTEINFMNKWLKEYGFKTEIICLACERAVMNIGQPKFSYIDSILTSWKENNIFTLEDIKKSDENFTNNKTPKEVKQVTAKKNKFNDYKQPLPDFNKLKKLERSLLDDTLEE